MYRELYRNKLCGLVFAIILNLKSIGLGISYTDFMDELGCNMLVIDIFVFQLVLMNDTD